MTENGARQQRMGRALDYGMVAINRPRSPARRSSFGGHNRSSAKAHATGSKPSLNWKHLCLTSRKSAGHILKE